MSSIDLEKLLSPVSPEKPSGDSVEDSPAYSEMVRAARGKPEQRMGDAVIPGEEPDWRGVKDRAALLLEGSKDLRAAVLLTQALLRTDGFSGLADGLALVRGLTERYWDSIHPQLDPEDGNDPTLRINTLLALADPDAMLRGVRDTPLASSRSRGRVSLRDVLIATGRMPSPASDATLPDMAAIEGVFRECDAEHLQKETAAVARATEELRGLVSALDEKAGTGSLLGLSELANLLKAAQKILLERLSGRGLSGAAAGDAGAAAHASAGPDAGPGGAMSLDGEVRSREQAIQILDKVSEFFLQNEPSSPVPLLLRRAKRLISKSFMDIVRDLAPDAMPQVEKIRGEEGSE